MFKNKYKENGKNTQEYSFCYYIVFKHMDVP